MAIPTRKRLWDVLKEKTQIISRLTPSYWGTVGPYKLAKGIVSDIRKIKQGTRITPPPTNLPLKEQIKWWGKQSKQAQEAQRAIGRTVGGLQLGLQSFTPTTLGVSGAQYISKKRGLPSPLLKPSEINLSTPAKLGIEIGGNVASYMSVAGALGKVIQQSPLLVGLASRYPTLSRIAHTFTTLNILDQARLPFTVSLHKRVNDLIHNLPVNLGLSIGYEVPVTNKIAPSLVKSVLPAISGQFLSSKLQGKDTKEAFKDALITGATLSILKIPAIREQVKLQNIIKQQAQEILGVKPNASLEEIKQRYYDLSRLYHPDRLGGDATKFNAVAQAYKILTQPYPHVEAGLKNELVKLYRELTSAKTKQALMTLPEKMPVGLSIKAVPPEKPLGKIIKTPIEINSLDEAGNQFKGITKEGEQYIVNVYLPKVKKIWRLPFNTLDEAVKYAKTTYSIPAPSEVKTTSKGVEKPVSEAISKERGIKLPKQAEKPEIKAIPKELEPLAREARKYKSAEEFGRDILRARLISREELAKNIKLSSSKSWPSLRLKDALIKAEKSGIKSINIEDFYNQALKQPKPEVKAGEKPIKTSPQPETLSERTESLQKAVFPAPAPTLPPKQKTPLIEASTHEKEPSVIQLTGKKPSSGVIPLGGASKALPPASQPTGEEIDFAHLPKEEFYQKLHENLKQLEDLRPLQEERIKESVSKRTAKAAKAISQVASKEDYIKLLSSLKGIQGKIHFKPLSEIYSPAVQSRVYKDIAQSDLPLWDKIKAFKAWTNYLEGMLPEPAGKKALSRVIGEDIIKTLDRKSQTVLEKIGNVAVQIYNTPLSTMAGFLDLSATFTHGLLFATRHPILTLKGIYQSIRAFIGTLGNKDTFETILDGIKRDPDFPVLADKMGISFLEMTDDITTREQGWLASWIEHLPIIGKGFKATSRAWATHMNLARYWMGKQALELLRNSGLDIEKEGKITGRIVNTFTQRGPVKSLSHFAPALQKLFFSFSRTLAVFDSLNPYIYIRAPKPIRLEMVKIWLSYLAWGLGVYYLARTVLGAEDTSKDPTNIDFYRVKIGNYRFNQWGNYQSLAVLIARLLKGYITSSTTGQRVIIGEGYKPVHGLDIILRFFQTKQHPTLSYLIGLSKGQTAIGLPFEPGPELADRFISMVFSDIAEIIRTAKENNWSPIGTSLASMLVILGVPTMVYGKKIPIIFKDPITGKETLRLNEYPRLSDIVWHTLSKQPYSAIPRKDWEYLSQKMTADSARSYLRKMQTFIQTQYDNGKITKEQAQKEYKKIVEMMKNTPVYINGLSKDSPYVKEYTRLLNQGVSLPALKLRYWTYMSPTDIVAYNKKLDYQRKLVLRQIMNNPLYWKLNNTQKAKVLRYYINRAEKVVRILYIIHKLQQTPHQNWAKELGKMKKSGLLTREIYNLILKYYH